MVHTFDILKLTESDLSKLSDDEFLDVVAEVFRLKEIDLLDKIITRMLKVLERRGLVYDFQTGKIVELTPPTERRDH